jgi:hypothetical protein
MAQAVGRPDSSEIAPHAVAYLDLIPGDDVLSVLAGQVNKTIALLKPLSEEHASTFAYEPGKWTVKQIIGHLIDCERIFACRALRLARADTTPLPGFEQDSYVVTADSNRRPLAALLDELRSVRESSLMLLRSLPESAWLRSGRVSDWTLSVRGIAYTLTGHELHHFRILQERYLPGS